jgi:hypothetical protein
VSNYNRAEDLLRRIGAFPADLARGQVDPRWPVVDQHPAPGRGRARRGRAAWRRRGKGEVMRGSTMSARPCTVCEFHTFTYELDADGRCQTCAPRPGWRARIARRLADALRALSKLVGA